MVLAMPMSLENTSKCHDYTPVPPMQSLGPFEYNSDGYKYYHEKKYKLFMSLDTLKSPWSHVSNHSRIGEVDITYLFRDRWEGQRLPDPIYLRISTRPPS